MPYYPTRNSVSLNISGTTGAGGDYYDQIVALSQRTINENFKVLFNQQPTIGDIAWNDRTGSIKGTLRPPRIKLQVTGSDMPEYLFELPFASGTLLFNDQRTVDLKDWTLAVRAAIGDMSVSPAGKPNDTAVQKAKARQLWEETKFVYDTSKVEGLVAGDYSLQRLFTNITKASWSQPDPDRSTLPWPVGSTEIMSLTHWKSKEKEDSEIGLLHEDVSKFIGAWAAAKEHSNLWNIGMSLRQMNMNEKTNDPNKPTYVPSDQRLQVYPFADEATQGEQSTGDRAIVGKYGDENNCFVYCETVGRDLPVKRQIQFQGNLADATTPGTYVLDHRQWFIGPILGQLKSLCLVMNLIPIRPKIIHNDPNANHGFETGFVVGTNPENKSVDHPGLPNQVATDPSFNLDYKSPGVYEWSTTLSAPGSNGSPVLVDNCAFSPVYRKWNCGTTNSIRVTWPPGSDIINVKGKIDYYGHEYWSSGSRDFEDQRGKGLWYEGHNTITVNWDFDIKMVPDANQGSTEKCAVKPTFQRVEFGMPANFDPKYSQQFVLDDTGKNLTKQLSDKLKAVLPPIMTNIESAFVNTGRFTYPGTRVLTYGPPQINDYGDIMSTIDYKPIEAGYRVVIQPPKNVVITTPPDTSRTPPITSNPIPGNPTGTITWDIHVEDYKPVENRATITFKGTNTTGEKKGFSWVQLRFHNGANGAKPLWTDRQHWKSAKEIDAINKEAERKKKEEEARLKREEDERKKKEEDDRRKLEDDIKKKKEEEERKKKEDEEKKKQGDQPSKEAGKGEQKSDPVKTDPVKPSDEESDGWTMMPTKAAVSARVAAESTPSTSQVAATPSTPSLYERYTLTSSGIDQATIAFISTAGPALQFTVQPDDGEDTKFGFLDSRFIMNADAFFSLQIEGTIPGPGQYILEITEVLNSTQADKTFENAQKCTCFYNFKLLSGGATDVQRVSQATADQIRGIVAKPNP